MGLRDLFIINDMKFNDFFFPGTHPPKMPETAGPQSKSFPEIVTLKP